MNQNLAILPKPRIIPPKLFAPKIQTPKSRPQSAKYMTIVFGILQSDGILFAADTEETGQHLTLSTPKLYSYSRASGENLIIGGAGSPFSVETMQQRLGKSFLVNSATFEQSAEVLIKEFHDEQVAIDPNRDFWLIFGGSFKIGEDKYTHRLWISEHGCVRNSERTAVIGADTATEIARNLLKRHMIFSTEPTSDLIAVHVLRLVKEQAHYCGKESMVWSISGPDVRKMPSRQAQMAEELSRQIDNLNAMVFTALFGSETTQRSADSKLANLRGEYAKLLRDLESYYVTEKDIERFLRDGI